MSCSICKEDGHNAKTCPKNNREPVQAESHVLWVKFDNVTPQQADELLKGAIDLKSAVAPNARGTFAKGTKSEMPQKIAEALKLNQTSISNEPKKIE
ncbi:hypothetical protein [Rheinheimera hassiensis]|uniref:hypothetical protein n=1 Tax=Rheinheimera hassiensis TaxID=1193627 RepID=UPI001F0638A4|nr:hypothetical protein [Rheinheimera hassiensis]